MRMMAGSVGFTRGLNLHGGSLALPRLPGNAQGEKLRAGSIAARDDGQDDGKDRSRAARHRG
jgi:hypothetical protein